MSNLGRREARLVLNNGIVFVNSQLFTQTITNQSISQFIEEQLKRIEGESSADVGGLNRNPRIGQVARIRRLQQDVSNLADAIIAEPSLLDPDAPSEPTEDASRSVAGVNRA